jgi:ATP-dependent 26S proteasome regulatory subunit
MGRIKIKTDEERKESRQNSIKKYNDKRKKIENRKDRLKYNTVEERKEARRISVKKYNDKRKEINKISYQNNKEEYSLKNKEYYLKNKEKIKYKVREYSINNKDKVREMKRIYVSNRRKTDILYKLKSNIRNLIYCSLKNKNYIKKLKTQEIIGCTIEEFKIYLENKFECWMNWNNHGLYNGELNYGWGYRSYKTNIIRKDRRRNYKIKSLY